MAVGLVSRDGLVVRQAQIPTPRTGSSETLFAALAQAITGVLGEGPSHAGEQRADPVVVCGVGCGGPMSLAEGRVSPLNIPAWQGFPLQERLRDLTGLSVSVDNDAKALALGEGWMGAARGRSDFLAMVVSTGVGGGIVLDGRLLDGASGNAGHVGHVVVEPEGRRCSCGARGCLEAEASGSAIAVITGRPPSEAPPEIIERAGRMVGRAVGSVSNLLDLEITVVAGSVALGFGSPFFAAANAELRERARLSFSKSGRIVPAGLGARAPLVGAGAVGWRSVGCEVLTCPT